MTSDARPAITGLPADRLAARAAAHALIEQTQVAPRPDLLARLTAQAEAAGWGEVTVLLLHCEVIARGLRGEPYPAVRAASDAMLAAAEATGDEILVAVALAARAVFVIHSGEEDVGDLLSRAVTMLEDAEAEPAGLGPRAVELPVGYVECGQAFHRLALWELEEEMYARAAAALLIPVPAVVRPVGVFTRRVLVINRLEGATALACALLELGERETARQVAVSSVRPTPAERADLPPIWGHEVDALGHLLDAIAGSGAAVPAELYDRLAVSTWPGYRACLLLAAALGAHDRGDRAGAAVPAEEAVAMLDDYKPSITTYALHLAAGADGDGPARRYARHLAALRWQTRLAVLGAVRSRIAAARVLRQGEQLSRQAYVDALTGCANRHAETPHLARLRRRGPRDRLAVVLVDVDHFKAVNDTFGHAAGDEVLRVIGTVLRAAIRPTDLAVRLGGDEFMLLVDLLPGDGEPRIADGVVRAVTGHPWPEVAAGLRVGVSAGQAAGAARDVDELIRAADDNLYRAKAAGRGRAVGVG